jgi:hypothetical protein
MEDYWDDVEVAVQFAQGIAFDTCHKIYVLMDDKQVSLMREYEYDEIRTRSEMTPAEMFDTLKKWYAESCGLKFIQGVHSVGENEDENDGFTTLIPQGAEQEEECDDCGEQYCKGVCNDYDDEEDED